MATLTLGSAGQPSAKTINFDALFTTSLANAKKTLIDNISASNAWWAKIKSMGGYVSEDGGTHIEEPLMYGLGNFHWYDGYDELRNDPFEGLTKALYEWAQGSAGIPISRKEVRQNAHKILDLVSTKIEQAEMGIQEAIPKAIFQGNVPNGGALTDPAVDPILTATGINPIALLVHKDPTASANIGSIAQNSHSWWRNFTDSSGATTYDGLLLELSALKQKAGRGPGGAPDLFVTDETTYNLLEFALYQRARHEVKSRIEFPFENIIYKNAMIVHDEFMHDVENGLTNTDTKGTLYMLNNKFIKVKYDSQTNFFTTDKREPVNQDAWVKYILWMGNMTINNRRKHGVLYNIARTLT